MADGCRTRPNLQARYSEATTKFQLGESDTALELAEAGYHQAENRDPAWSWRFRILKAQMLLRKHAANQSASLLEAQAPSNLDVQLATWKMIVQAQALCNSGKERESEALLSQAEGRASTIDQVLRAEMEFVRGDCAFLPDPVLARSAFLTSAQLAHGVDAYVEARALGNAAYLLMRSGRYDQAIEEFTAALGIARSPWLQEAILGDLGECFVHLGDWKTAASYSHQAETIASRVKDAVHDRAKWLIDLGLEHFSQNEFTEAEKAYSQALAIASRLDDSEITGIALGNLAWGALSTGQIEKAKEYVRQSGVVGLTGEPYLWLLVTKARLARLDGDLASAERLLLQALLTKPDASVRWRAQSDLASIYWQESKLPQAERMFRDAIMAAEEAFSHVGNEQFRISFLDQNPFYDEYVRFLVTRNRPLDALAITELGRSRALSGALEPKGGKQGVDLALIQRWLRSGNQTVLAYWLSPQESYLWLITPSQMKLFKLLPEMTIVREIDAYNRDILDRTSEESTHGEKLYQMLVAPAEKLIPKGSKIIIVPHRRLAKLNFETLISPEPAPHYWIEDVCIQSASFLALLESPRHAHANYSKELLLMGAPVEASKDFPGLQHASEEMGKVAGRFSPAKEAVIAGADATPAAYRSSNPGQFRYFHFVTHGTANDTNPLDSAIILSPSPGGYKLYARDIIKTKIHPDLVTISTCYGAGTRQYSGEGLVGLAWAFMRAGAHEVIAALWEADDEANAELMDWFYGELAKGSTPAAALRDAKLKMLHSGTFRRAPYYWAPLQVYTGP